MDPTLVRVFARNHLIIQNKYLSHAKDIYIHTQNAT
jgi:hypothetical protein